MGTRHCPNETRKNRSNMIALFRKNKKQKVHFLHIGKTGGSAVKFALKEYSKTSWCKITFHDHKTSLSDIPEGEKIFFFLRDPISRFISGFYSRQRKGLPRYYSEWTSEEKLIFETFNTPNEIACGLAEGSSAAVEAMHNVQHLKKYKYWYRDFEYFRSRIEDILFIGFQETLHKDFLSLKSILDVPKNSVLPTDDFSAHRNPTKINKSISDYGISALNQWYREDIRFLSICQEIMSDKYTCP